MENYLHDAWVLFTAIGGWIANKLHGKLDQLSNQKADSDALNGLSGKVHEVEKKVDKLGLTSIGRPEHKEDYNSLIAKINDLHIRINDMEKRKSDRITRVDVKMRKEDGGQS